MTTQFNDLKEQLERVKNQKNALEESIKEFFKDEESVQERLKELEKQVNNGPYNYGTDIDGTAGLVITCKAFNETDEDILQLKEEALKELILDSQCAYLLNGSKTELFFMSPDPEAIIVNHEGDVFQENKVIISKSEYENQDELKELIEKHMEKTGCFPATLKQDYYGGLTYFKTQE